MENLFDYATKELSQDAFLRWLFENYNDPTIGDVANRLLGNLCNLGEDEKVQSLETQAQWCKIDISVWLTTTKNRKIALFIEDKTFSNEHSQLMVYDSHIDAVEGHEIYKVFFKTDVVENEEEKRIKEANAKNKVNWETFDIKKIYPFFVPYLSNSNLILSQYAEHIEKIYKSITNVIKPNKSNDNIDWLQWKAYFNNVVIPALEGQNTKYWCGTWKVRHPYVILYVKKLGYGERDIPYLEIRSRDCQKNNFRAKILCYGIDDKDVSQQQSLIDNIIAHPKLNCKYLRKRKNGVDNYFPKQVGFSLEGLTATTDEEFISLVKNHIDYYLQVMKDWK